MSVTEKIKAHKHLLINVGIALIFFAGGYFTRFFTAGTTEPSGFPGTVTLREMVRCHLWGRGVTVRHRVLGALPGRSSQILVHTLL